MTQRIRENDEYAAFARRAIKGLSRRIAQQGDVDALPLLIELERVVADAIDDAMTGLRHDPWKYSWAQIGDRLGMTRQGVQRRWGHVGGDRQVGGQPAHLR
jgi:hypothetical protein